MIRKRYLVGITLFILLFVVTSVFDNARVEKLKTQAKEETVRKISLLRAHMEGVVATNFYLVQGLVNEISLNPGIDQRDFEIRAALLMAHSDIVSHVAAARDMRVTHIHPYDRYKSVIGLDYREVPEQREAIFQAVKEGGLIIAGPVELVQGGQAFIGRTPVFLENGSVWGAVSTVIRRDDFYEAVGLANLTSELQISIRGKNGTGAQGPVFYGNGEVFELPDSAKVNISLPFGSWQVAAFPVNGYHVPFSERIWYWFGFAVITTLGIGITYLQNRADDLRNRASRIIDEKTLFDPLTHLPNHYNLEKRCNEHIYGENTKGNPMVMYRIAIDGFRLIRDALGYSYSDLILREMAAIILEQSEENDFTARLDGGEFALIAFGLENETQIAEKGRAVTRAMNRTLTINGRIIHTCASVGASAYPRDGLDYTELLRHADQAVSEAYKSGGNKFLRFNHEMDEKTTVTHNIRHDLEQALNSGQLVVYYQPIRPLDGSNTIKCEALVRWIHPVKGMVPPDLFIPIAEQFGLVRRIDDFVFEAATRELHELSKQINHPIHLSLNKSPIEFAYPSVFEEWIERIKRNPLPREQLTIEITETMLFHNPEKAAECINTLKDLGLQLALDDFGTGYSSLSYLTKFRFDFLKIDKTFITGDFSDEKERMLVESILNIAETMKMVAVAEGVETEAQLEFLRRRGCGFAQGYFFCKPVPILDFKKYVEKVLAGTVP